MTAPQVPGDGKEGRGRLCYSCGIEPATGIGRCRTCDHPASSSSAPVTGLCTCMCSAVGPHTHEPEAAPVTGDAQPIPAEVWAAACAWHEAPQCSRFEASSCRQVVLAVWPLALRAASQSGDAQRALLDAADAPQDVFVVFYRSGFQAVYETREAAVEDCDDYLAKCWTGSEIVEDWTNLNVPEARPAWFRYFTAPDMAAPPSWQEIRVRPLLRACAAALTGSPDTGEGDT